MASERRLQRFNSTIKREISEIIQRELKDPRMTAMVSILDVSISKDLRNVKVVVSLFSESEKGNMNTLEALNHASGFISSIISKNLRMRTAPDIQFIYSDSIARGIDMYHKLKDLQNDTKSDTDN